MRAKIDLLLVDVDGTLLTPDKRLTAEAKKAVAELRSAKIRVALTSARPPRGMAMVSGPLAVDTPVSAFNGGLVVEPDLRTVLATHLIKPDDARGAILLMEEHGLDVWLYTAARWLVRDPTAPHVEHESRAVQFSPDVVASFSDEDVSHALKIVGVTDDRDRMSACRAAAQEALRDVTAGCSQPHYLDVTHAKANKGEVVEELARRLGIPRARIATMGDMPNDIPMFERSGLSIAMGQSSAEVKDAADEIAPSNEENGFARAVRRFILDARPWPREAAGHAPAPPRR